VLHQQLVVLPTAVEQDAIAEALSDADALIESLEQLIAKKRHLKQGAMQELLTGKRRLPGFGGEWEIKRLGAVLRFQVGFPFSSTFFNEEGQGIRLVKNRDLKNDDQVFHYSGQYDPTFLVENGDVLVGMDGDFLPCLWAKNQALLNQRTGRVIPYGALDRVFAFYYLIEPLKEIEYATSSTTVKHLSHGDIEGIEKRLPALPEQTAIATVLSDMDAEIAALEAKLAKARQVKQGMMQELLTGRIRLV
jgi:type I restriction enzyme, S subunit